MSEFRTRTNVLTKYAQAQIRTRAKQLVRRPGFSSWAQEDIEQELTLHLLERADRFDPRRGSLNTFVARVVASGAAMLARKVEREKRWTGQKIRSLSELEAQPDGPPLPLDRIVEQKDLDRRRGTTSVSSDDLFELAADIESIIASLPPKLQRVCRSLRSSNLKETEADVGLSRRRLRKAIDMIRQHFRNLGFERS